MDGEKTLDIRFLAEPVLIDLLEAELSQQPDGAHVISKSEVKDATTLSFNIGQLVGLITEVNAAVVAGSTLVNILLKVFKKQESPTRLTIESPLGKVSFETKQDMSEEEIRSILRKLTEL